MYAIDIPRTQKYNKEQEEKLINKLLEENQELLIAINKKDLRNIAEEAFDVIQMSIKVLEFFEIDIYEAEEKHIEKLEKRGIVLK